MLEKALNVPGPGVSAWLFSFQSISLITNASLMMAERVCGLSSWSNDPGPGSSAARHCLVLVRFDSAMRASSSFLARRSAMSAPCNSLPSALRFPVT